MIHHTAIISPAATLAKDLEIGPYCIIGGGVTLASGCHLTHHVSLQGPSSFGARNIFHPFCSIGNKTQDLKYTGEPTLLEVGEDNEFREFVTVNRGTAPGEKTIIGSHNLFLTYSHVAHNCEVGNYCILSNNGTLAGHVIVEDYAIISGLAAVHQFCRIGQHSLVGGCTKIVKDVPPYFIADGNPAEISAVNLVGLQRRNFSDEDIQTIRAAFKKFCDPKLNTSQAMQALTEEFPDSPHVQNLINFVNNSQRGVIR
ncbi:MAG: acyl-ACP--UDP-N-acetylglucosamine O-acyltransferase [Blastochloris sp.]|jgi:UDP-N-acetylglucosamine acyltransferase|nr:acyl-ACP--UDP-N-acetylglucosamine O-acyltransferase [Blastochloris sp.]